MANLKILIGKFRHEWQAGRAARVHLECHAGQAWRSLHLHVGHPPPAKQHKRHPGHSRLRRRARREEACAAANNAASRESTAAVVTAEKAVQTVETTIIPTKIPDPTVQVKQHHTPAPQPIPAVQVVAKQNPHHISAEEAQLQSEPTLPTFVCDAFCPDEEYHPAEQAAHRRPVIHHHTMPQLDGLAPTYPSDSQYPTGFGLDMLCQSRHEAEERRKEHEMYLLEQRRIREAEIKRLEANLSLGFKPNRVKKPF